LCAATISPWKGKIPRASGGGSASTGDFCVSLTRLAARRGSATLTIRDACMLIHPWVAQAKHATRSRTSVARPYGARSWRISTIPFSSVESCDDRWNPPATGRPGLSCAAGAADLVLQRRTARNAEPVRVNTPAAISGATASTPVQARPDRVPAVGSAFRLCQHLTLQLAGLRGVGRLERA